MKKAPKKATSRLNAAIASAVKNFAPPEELTVSEWAEKYRRLSPESAAEAGPWRTSRTPYLEEPMNAFNDPKVSSIVMVAASQVGKSEFLLNCIAYTIGQDPASTMFIQPTLDDARKFSRLRIAPMIRDSKPLRTKVSDVKSRDSGNTILQKAFPGGMLTITGSNSASALASTPARYIFGDERDRWAASAGTEGDPWELAKARQATFYNRKSVETSTPTIKGRSNIETSFDRGTQERWCHQCPSCGEWHEIRFDDIRFDYEEQTVNRKKNYIVKSLHWLCKSCGCLHTEDEMRRQPAKWIADNPDAYKRGVRSFWLTAFASPWMPWATIIQRFLEARKDPERLKVVYNTLLANIGSMRNSGLEIAIGITPLKTQDMELNINANITFQQNKLLSLSGMYNGELISAPEYKSLASLDGAGFHGGYNHIVYQVVGQPLGVFYLPRANGLVSDGNGGYTYDIADLNGGGVSLEDGEDRYVAGQAVPKTILGSNLSFRYKRFDISVQINGAFGHKIYNGTSLTYMNMNIFPDYNVMQEAPARNIKDQTATDYWLENGAYVNFDYVTLGWNVPIEKVQKLKKYVRSLRLAFTVNNLATISGYSGLSPMINSSTVNSTLGLDDKRGYPLARTYTLGLSINF